MRVFAVRRDVVRNKRRVEAVARRLATPFALALPLVACLDHPPTATHLSANLAIEAVVAQLAPGEVSLDVDVSYRLLDGLTQGLPVTPPSFILSHGQNTEAVNVDLTDCVHDAAAGLTALSGGVSACLLEVQLTLSDDAGVFDATTISVPGNVRPGATVDLPQVTLGGVSNVVLTPKSPVQVPYDTVRVFASTQTASGRNVQRTVTFSSSNTAVATVDATGLVTARSIGQTNITATSDGHSASVPFVVRRWTSAEAASLRVAALAQLNGVTGGFAPVSGTVEGIFVLSGLLADEWRSGDTFAERNETDRRTVSSSNGILNPLYRALLDAHRTALVASSAYANLYLADSLTNPNPIRVAQADVDNAAGLLEVLVAENFCSGTALIDVDPVTAAERFGPAESSTQLYARASARFTMAVNNAVAAANDPGSPAVLNQARSGRARAFLGVGNFPQALSDASQVSSSFVLNATYSGSAASQNGNWALNINRGGYSVADSEGTNGAFFRSALDPRLPVVSAGRLAVDNQTPLFFQQRYTAASSPIPLGSGTEAALIRAEARLGMGDQAGALTEINALRRTVGLAPASITNIDLIVRERAFWLFGTGHRLGDLRRLVRQYGRAATQIFPVGTYAKGGSYGTDVNFPISDPGDGNPNYRGCFDRNP